jgi:hypothetical protein
MSPGIFLIALASLIYIHDKTTAPMAVVVALSGIMIWAEDRRIANKN